jgi:hypothetical protein
MKFPIAARAFVAPGAQQAVGHDLPRLRFRAESPRIGVSAKVMLIVRAVFV